MKSVFMFFVSFLLFSCITTHKVRDIDHFRIETEDNLNEEVFVFKPKMLPEEARRSLRKQFHLLDNQKLSDFDTKLFNDLDFIFNIRISFETDRQVNTNLISSLIDKEIENEIGSIETFVKIIVLDSEGNNCLSQKSLFCNKVRSFLIEIRDTVQKEKYYNNVIPK